MPSEDGTAESGIVDDNVHEGEDLIGVVLHRILSGKIADKNVRLDLEITETELQKVDEGAFDFEDGVVGLKVAELDSSANGEISDDDRGAFFGGVGGDPRNHERSADGTRDDRNWRRWRRSGC